MMKFGLKTLFQKLWRFEVFVFAAILCLLQRRIFLCKLLGEVVADRFRLQDDHDRDDQGFEGHRRFGNDTEIIHEGNDRTDNDGTDDRTGKAELTAVHVCTADNYCQDRVHFIVEARVVGVVAHDAAGVDQAGDRGKQTGDRINNDDHFGGVNTCQTACTAVDADGFNEGTKCCLANENVHQNDHRDRDDDRHRQRKHMSLPDHAEGRILRGELFPVRNDLGYTASADHQDQGGDDRLNVADTNQETVKHSHQDAYKKRNKDRQSERLDSIVARSVINQHIPAHEFQSDRPRNGYQSAHRKVRTAESDDERHAQSDNCDFSGTVDDIDQRTVKHSGCRLITDLEEIRAFEKAHEEDQQFSDHSPKDF